MVHSEGLSQQQAVQYVVAPAEVVSSDFPETPL